MPSFLELPVTPPCRQLTMHGPALRWWSSVPPELLDIHATPTNVRRQEDASVLIVSAFLDDSASIKT